MSRFADAKAVTRYDLSAGDWVELRNELSFQERRAVEAGALRGKVDQANQQIDIDIDWPSYETSRLAGWIFDWSFSDVGEKVPVSRAAINRLSTDTAKELIAVLDRHIERVDGDEGKASGEAS